jgi:5'-methylthioadenosine phosphorylase
MSESSGDRLAVIVGHSLPFDDYVGGAERIELPRPRAGDDDPIVVLDVGRFLVLPRHGIERFRPAHLLDHHAHVAALESLGCDRILGIASSGSLRTDWGVGTSVVPDDFLALHVTPSRFTDARGHSVPGFDVAWRQHVIDTWRSTTETPVIDGATYAQTTGPRFESPAEVRFLAAFADLVGMTLVDEIVLTREAGIPYAAICTIDNLANGLDDAPLDVDEFRANLARNQRRLRTDLDALLTALTGRG